MSATETEDTRAAAPTPPHARGATDAAPIPEMNPIATETSTAHWWMGVLAGAVVMSPLAWLLSHAATLPFFIGVFFFALFGLVVGAVVHRMGVRGGSYSRANVLLGTTGLVLFGWGGSVVLESARFPDEVAKYALEQSLDIGNQTAESFRSDVANRTREHLGQQFPPGGVLGYAKWSLLSGRLLPKDVTGLQRPFRSGQAKFWWAVRLTISIALLAFGIGSQTLALVDRTGHIADTPSATE